VHDRDLVGEHHRFFLIVRHVHGGDRQALLELPEVDPRLFAQLGVQVRQGLVHQEHARLEHQRAGDGHPLPLAARQGGGRPLGEVRHLHELEGVQHALTHLRRCRTWSGYATLAKTVMCGQIA
jgi:hypothetical protein